jgi:hypothetical protein
MTDQNKKDITELFSGILGVRPNVEEIFDSPEAKNKGLFIRFVSMLEEINIRSAELYGLYGIDISRMEELYFSCIEDLISLHYPPKTQEMIYWYLNERFDNEGNEYPLEDTEGNKIYVKTPEVLYDIIKLLDK